MKSSLVLVSGLLTIATLSAPAQDFNSYRIEKVDGGFRFTDGPAWSSREDFLVFSDPVNNALRKMIPGSRSDAYREDAAGAAGNAFDNQGRLYTCESRARRVVRVDRKGKEEVVADQFEGKHFNGPNDIAVRRDGQVYFTDPAFGDQLDQRELDYFGVFQVPPKGTVTAIARWKTRPNGIVLSPNGRLLYVSNSDERKVYAYDLDRGGTASNERPFATGIDGPPSGMCVDEKGNLYVTANKIHVYSPQGTLLHSIQFGETPRGCAFGDPDLATLYVTAHSSVYRLRLNVKGSTQH
jgi:gluconolactonase